MPVRNIRMSVIIPQKSRFFYKNIAGSICYVNGLWLFACALPEPGQESVVNLKAEAREKQAYRGAEYTDSACTDRKHEGAGVEYDSNYKPYDNRGLAPAGYCAVYRRA